LPPIRRVEVVANVASGSVGADAPQEIAKILSDHGIEANVCAPHTSELGPCLRRCVDADPDLLIILAGDGTARTAAEMCGPDGPIVAPLPGGTMNMLPHAIFGVRPWQEALTQALEHGEVRAVGGGEVDGHRFLVSAIMGSPALWAPAREAVRVGRHKVAWLRARRALRQAFSGRLKFSLDGGAREEAEALIFMCPTTSRILDEDEQVLEAAALNINGVAEVFRLGFNALVRDWRDDPAVESRRCRKAKLWSAQGVPALLDGESVRLRRNAEVHYTPAVARMLTLPKDA
jgi:diacylglycerol kinase family enzyme